MPSSSDNIRRMKAEAEQAKATRAKMAGLFGKAHDAMPWYDKAALYTSLVPVLGDVAGLGADAITFAKEPTLTNASLGLAGLLPWVPSAGVTKTIARALPNAPNFLGGFYSGKGGKFGQKLMAGVGAAKGAKNLFKARYSPTGRGLWSEGLSYTDNLVAKQALNVIKKADQSTQEGRKIAKQAAKKAIGQFDQSTLMSRQMGQPSKFHKITEGVDNVGFSPNFSANDYASVLGGIKKTGLDEAELNSVFNVIKTLPAIGYDSTKKYQLAVRRSSAQAGGDLISPIMLNRRLFGGSTLDDLKKIFGGVKEKGVWKHGKSKSFKTDKEFLEALRAKKIDVKNPEEVLKGMPAVVTGSSKSDSYVLGGVNYMTSINKKGKLTSFVNDEHDLFKQKMPKGDRMFTVSTPIKVNLLTSKKPVPKVNKPKQIAAEKSMNKLKEYSGVDLSTPVPKGVTREQLSRIQAVANTPFKKDYSRVAIEAGMFGPGRASKPLGRADTDPDRMIEYNQLVNQLDLSEGGYALY